MQTNTTATHSLNNYHQVNQVLSNSVNKMEQALQK